MTAEEKRAFIDRLTPEQKTQMLRDAGVESGPWQKDENTGLTKAIADFVETKNKNTGSLGMGGKKI